MKHFRTVRTATALLGVLSLSACLGNGGGGGGAGGGGGGGGTAYDTAYSQIINEGNRQAGKAPTHDMPTTGTAKYAGQTQLQMRDGSAGADVLGVLTGDVNLTAALQVGNSANVSGTASNFEYVKNDGTVHAVDGTLTAGDTATFTVNVTEAQELMGQQIPELRAGVTTLGYRGTLSGLVEGQTESADVLLSGLGSAYGPGGESIAGEAAIQSFDTQTGINPIYGSGTFYMNKQP